MVKICNTADDALSCQLAEAVEWEEDIPVLLKAAAVVIGRYMAHYEVVGLCIPRNDPVITRDVHGATRPERERTVATQVQAGGRYEGDPPLFDRRPLDPRAPVEHGTIEIEQARSGSFW